MTSRELLKDAEDVEGDRAGGASTLPMGIGIRSNDLARHGICPPCRCSERRAICLVGVWYLGGIAVVDVVIVVSVFLAFNCNTPACVKASGASTFLKAGMFASLDRLHPLGGIPPGDLVKYTEQQVYAPDRSTVTLRDNANHTPEGKYLFCTKRLLF